MFKCCVCAQDLASPSSLRQHEGRHSKNAPYSCEEFDIVFFSRANFDRHLMTHSEEEIREFECGECKQTFLTEKDLRRHQRREQRKLPVSCDVCGQQFEDKGKLGDHTSVYTGMKHHL